MFVVKLNKAGLGDVCTSAVITPDHICYGFYFLCRKNVKNTPWIRQFGLHLTESNTWNKRTMLLFPLRRIKIICVEGILRIFVFFFLPRDYFDDIGQNCISADSEWIFLCRIVPIGPYLDIPGSCCELQILAMVRHVHDRNYVIHHLFEATILNLVIYISFFNTTYWCMWLT